MTIINAFHKDYVKTHMPEFLTAVKTEDRQSQAGSTLSKHVTEKRKTVPSHGQVVGISKAQRETVPNQNFQDISAFPKTRETQLSLRRGAKMTVAEVASELKPREFRTYSRAGTANVTPKGKKK